MNSKLIEDWVAEQKKQLGNEIEDLNDSIIELHAQLEKLNELESIIEEAKSSESEDIPTLHNNGELDDTLEISNPTPGIMD